MSFVTQTTGEFNYGCIVIWHKVIVRLSEILDKKQVRWQNVKQLRCSATSMYVAKLWQLLREILTIVVSRQRRKEMLASFLYVNSNNLIINGFVINARGFLFWMLVVRLYSAEDVGLASALVPTGVLLATMASLELGIGLIRFLPSGVQRQLN